MSLWYTHSTYHTHNTGAFRVYFQFPSIFFFVQCTYDSRKHIIHNLAPIRIFAMHKYVTMLILATTQPPYLPKIFAYTFFCCCCRCCVLLECLTEFLYTHGKFARRTLKAYLSFGICVYNTFSMCYSLASVTFSIWFVHWKQITLRMTNVEYFSFLFFSSFLLMNRNKATAACIL